MPPPGMLRGYESLQIGPLLPVDLKRAVGLLPFVIDNDCAYRQLSLIEDGEPLLVIGLCRERIGFSAVGDRFDGLLSPSAKDGQVVPVNVSLGQFGVESVLVEPRRVALERVQRAKSKLDR